MFYPVFVLFFILFSPSFLFGVSNDPLMLQQQQQQYEHLNHHENIDSPPLHLPSQEVRFSETNDSRCFVTHTIVLHHVTLLSPSQQHTLIAPYIGGCNGLSELQRLSNQFTQAYVEKGYITSRVYLIPQDIADGEVELSAIEGKIASVIRNDTSTFGAFVGLKNTPLNLKTLENRIAHVNRLHSAHTTVTLIPSKEEGSSDLNLTTQTLPKTITGSLGGNNYGIDAMGQYQFYSGMVWENMVGLSDIFTLNLNTTNAQETGKKSFGDAYGYSIPLGAWLLEATANRFAYNQTIYGLNDSYLSRGTSEVYAVGGSTTWFHTATQKSDFSAKVIQKKNSSTIDGAVIGSSTYTLGEGNVAVKYGIQHPSWESTMMVEYSQGLRIFNASKEGALTRNFSKWTLSMNFTKFFSTSMRYNFSGLAQYTPDLLYSIEQLSIGGAYSVRGFGKEIIRGERGGYGRNEILFQTSPTLGTYLAYDLGHIQSGIDTAGGTLSSTTLGLRTHTASWDMDVYHTLPLHAPSPSFGTRPFIGVSITTHF